jgi:MFS family permease
MSTRAWYTLLLLHLAYVCSFVDRTLLSMLVTPIKADLGVSDTQMSLLIGAAFSVFYVVAGIPIARLSDRYVRRDVILVGMVLWSLATSAGSLALSFTTLFLLRVMVAVGESTLSPSALSMLSDLFPKDKLSTASSIYAAAAFVGTGLSLFGGGALIDALTLRGGLSFGPSIHLQPWQAVFLLAGLPGLVVAALMMLTLREPARRPVAGERLTQHAPAFAEFVRYVFDNRGVYLRITIATTMFSLMGYALSSWLPTYFTRVFALSNTEIGAKLGVMLMVGGGAGVVAGGMLGSALFHKHRDAVCLIGMGAAVGALLCGVSVTLIDNANLAFLLVLPAFFFKSLPNGVALAAIVLVTPSRMRAQSIALYLLFDSLIGFGLGPTAVAVLTDFVFRDEALLGYALAAVIAFAMPTAFVLYRNARAGYRDLLGSLQADPDPGSSRDPGNSSANVRESREGVL